VQHFLLDLAVARSSYSDSAHLLFQLASQLKPQNTAHISKWDQYIWRTIFHNLWRLRLRRVPWWP